MYITTYRNRVIIFFPTNPKTATMSSLPEESSESVNVGAQNSSSLTYAYRLIAIIICKLLKTFNVSFEKGKKERKYSEELSAFKL